MHSLVWPIKRSFTTYIERMPDGVIAVEGGVSRREDGFSFPGERSAGSTVTRFAGSVTFVGHYGMLYLPVGGVEIVESVDGGAVLTIADEGSPTRRCTLLRLGEPTVEGSRRTYASPVLTEEGAELFLDNYPAGSPFDPLEILEEDAA